jgi:origin recognition complex subunit 5
MIYPYPSQVPQRLLGPSPFPLDRMLAILGVLLEEYDAEARAEGGMYQQQLVPGAHTELAIQRTSVLGTVRLLFALPSTTLKFLTTPRSLSWRRLD